MGGVSSTTGVFIAQIYAEKIDQMNSNTSDKAFPGLWGFEFDDVLYLFAPIVWLGWQMPYSLGTNGAGAYRKSNPALLIPHPTSPASIFDDHLPESDASSYLSVLSS